MALTVTYPIIYAPAVENSFTRVVDLPPFVACPRYPILNFTSTRGQQWNCQKCTISPYFGLYEVGDKIPIQLNLPDARNGIISGTGDVSNPLIGWRQSDLSNPFWYVKAEIYDGSTVAPTLIYSLVDQFCSDWWVGYSNLVGSVQTLIIDTSLLPLGVTMFRVKVTTVNPLLADEIVVWSEPFCTNKHCTTNVKLEGSYSTIDCYNRDYRQPVAGATSKFKYIHTLANATNPVGYIPTPFYSSWRVRGEVVQTGFGAEKTLNDLGKVVKFKRIETSQLVVAEMMPPYAAQIISSILQADQFTVDGVQYDDATDVSKNEDAGREFFPSIELIKNCSVNNNACD